MQEGYYPLVRAAEERHWWFRGRRAVLQALLDRAGVAPPRRVLDAGCGTGRNLEDLRRLGEARGVDPSEDAVRFCRERGLEGVEQAGVEALPFADGTFDLVLAADVLEHTDDDGVALRELHRVAAPGALLVATVPAYAWLWSRSDEALEHRRRYTRARLAAAGEAAGWEPRLATYFNSLLLPPIALVRKLRGGSDRPELEATPSWLDGALSLPMRLEAALIARGVRLPAGVSIGMVCQRR